MNTFICSDTHFCHDKEFIWKSRGFKSVEDMNDNIIQRWNAIVAPDDIVFHLGDMMLGDLEQGLDCVRRLNGGIAIVWGNHETEARKTALMQLPNIISLGYAHVLKYGKHRLYLSHYPTLTANYDDKKFTQHVINFHGHVHSKTPWIDENNPFMYDVGMDAHNCAPILLDLAIEDVKNKYLTFTKTML